MSNSSSTDDSGRTDGNSNGGDSGESGGSSSSDEDDPRSEYSVSSCWKLLKDCPNKEHIKEAEEIYYGDFYQRLCQNRGRYRANAPGYYVKDENKMGYQEKKPDLEEIMSKCMEENARRSKNIIDLVISVKTSNEATLRNQEATIKAINTKLEQIAHVVRERVPGTLSRSIETNPQDQVKAFTTIEGTQTNPNVISSLCPFVSCFFVQVE
ncbi:hypothetical protein Tco_0877607 [Tanacetum coccineum]|uniref:Uncharacterized protein n=1 Tax=Tanacetum coccineum TaxID=301880 RepID=A0ABQ5BYA0_9ASTR